MSLDNWRRELDSLDKDIAKKITDRLEIVGHVASAKQQEAAKDGKSVGGLSSLSVVRPMREKALLKGILGSWQGRGGKCLGYEIWRLFFGCSYREQGVTKIWGLVGDDEDGFGTVRDLVAFHFGRQMAYEQKKVQCLERVGEMSDLCIYDRSVGQEGCYWWSSLWQEGGRVLVNGALSQVRLRLDGSSGVDREEWWWRSDEEVARFWLVCHYGDEDWQDRDWPMDVLLFGGRVFDESSWGDSHDSLVSCGGGLLGFGGESGLEGVQYKLYWHKLYWIARDAISATTPRGMEADMTARFGEGGKIEWRLLGGYARPLDMDEGVFFGR